MNNRPLPLTVVLVSFNKEDVIGLAIESIAQGSMVPDLLVIADDGSTDNTLDVAAATAKKVGLPCRIIRHLRVGRYRLQTMRNSAVANALEGVILISDSDCLFGKYALESHYEIHRTNRLAVGTGPRFEFLEGTTGPFQTTLASLEFSHFPEGTYVVPVGANTSFKKSLWKMLGGFDRVYEGEYGMDEMEFSLRAEKAGAVCVSDPGAYLFHIPHGTIFGGRKADHNINIFNCSFGTDHVHREWTYIAKRVTPWYWRGNRKRPLLGDKIKLNSWGAPAGFKPPLHLQLSQTIMPLIEVVDPFLQTRDWAKIDRVWQLLAQIDPKMLGQTSPAFILIGDLRWILPNFPRLEDMVAHLNHWREGAMALEKELQKRQAENQSP